MRLGEFFKNVVRFGIDRDCRKGLRGNPFADTALLYGDPGVEVKKILVGIDIEASELLLAERIREKEGLDLVVSHHPEGKAFAALHEVMSLQIDLLVQAGLAEGVARHLMEERISEVARRLMPANHTRAVDAARLLDMPMLCMHTPADNHVAAYLHGLFAKNKPETPADIIDILMREPEYRLAEKETRNGPKVILGNPRRPVGKIMLEMTGGTEGPKDVYDKLYKKGIRTIVSMHLGEEHFRKVKDANLNVVIAGHISSDNVGMNLLLDRIERAAGGQIQTLDCSGFRRVRRK